MSSRTPYPVSVANSIQPSGSRVQRILAFMVASAVGLSVAALIAVLIGSASNADFSEGLWPTVVVLPLVGFPIGVLLIIVFIVLSAIRRR